MKPHELDAKMFHTIRLQNGVGSDPWNISIATLFTNSKPAFENIQVVSATVYEPAVAGMPQVLATNTTDDTNYTSPV